MHTQQYRIYTTYLFITSKTEYILMHTAHLFNKVGIEPLRQLIATLTTTVAYILIFSCLLLYFLLEKALSSIKGLECLNIKRSS